MGIGYNCNLCAKCEEENNEMINGSLPEKKLNGEEDDTNNQKDLELIEIPDIQLQKRGCITEFNMKRRELDDTEKTQSKEGSVTNTLETENITMNHERNNAIFDFFNELRSNPEKYIEEAKEYKLNEIIQTMIDINNNKNITHLIKNPFFNLLFESIINKANGNKDDIISALIEEMQIIDFYKQLYIVECQNNDPKEIIWRLIKNYKKIALKEILLAKIDYFIISSNIDKKTNYVKTYFLFLRKKKI